MKILSIVALLGLALAAQARAEYYAFCSLTSGSEKALLKAPKTFSVNEYGVVKLTTETDSEGKKTELSKEFSTEAGNLSADDGYPQATFKTSEGLFNGIYSVDLKSCEEFEKSFATFTWEDLSKEPKKNGNAFYNCDCAVD